MSDFYREELQAQLRRAALKFEGKLLKHDVEMKNLPATAKPQRRFTNKAIFSGVKARRKGYIATVNIQTYIDLIGQVKLTKQTEGNLEEHWQRGLVWKPLSLRICPVGDLWQVHEFPNLDAQIAHFFIKKKQEVIKIQIFTKDDTPATLDCLNSIIDTGLLSWGDDLWLNPIPIEDIKVTL